MESAHCTVAARTVSNVRVIDALPAAKGTPEGLYGRRKITHHLRLEGVEFAFCTLGRLIRDVGMNGVRRGKGVRTTIPARQMAYELAVSGTKSSSAFTSAGLSPCSEA